jgi:hypothetical protein
VEGCMRLFAALPPLLCVLLPTTGLVVFCLLPVCQGIKRHRSRLQAFLRGKTGRSCIGKSSSLSSRGDGAGGRVAVLPVPTCPLHQSAFHGSLRVECVGDHVGVGLLRCS